MPVIKSAAKRVKQAQKRQTRNLHSKKTLRENTKALEAAVALKKVKDLDKLLASVYGSYDMAVKKNLIHKNKAARKKSHYSNLVKSVSKDKKTPAAKTTKTPVAKK